MQSTKHSAVNQTVSEHVHTAHGAETICTDSRPYFGFDYHAG